MLNQSENIPLGIPPRRNKRQVEGIINLRWHCAEDWSIDT